ncbi:hypothetical protein ABZU53_04800 [Micromonospora sp. NPDC005194]|uniref:hypothetical protein n=1 Tax=Micromonospora sp. NPDC005194 TaxID=3156870 RepID=UPI0033B6B70C
MGLEDLGLWVAVSSISAVVLAGARLLHFKIKADRDRALAEMALRDTKPNERPAILDSLAGLRPFNPQVADGPESDDQPSLPGQLSRKKRR